MFPEILIMLAGIASVASPVSAAVPDTQSAEIPSILGSCISEHGPVDMRRVLFLENRAMEYESSRGRILITLQEQSVKIMRLGDSDTIYIRDIGSVVPHSGGDADIFVKLALLDNRLLIYWRETFQHRIYRQGLLRIRDVELSALCEGFGGTEASH